MKPRLHRASTGRASGVAAFCALLCASLPAAAEIYKWVDENGNLHFSGSPPPGQNAENLTPGKANEPAPTASSSSPSSGIAYRGSEPSKLAYLESVRVHFDDIPPGRSKVVGEFQKGASCSRSRDIEVKNGHEPTQEATLRWQFHDRLKQLGYRSPRELKTKFDLEGNVGPDLTIIALIVELDVTQCDAQERRRTRRGILRTVHREKNSSSIAVEWQVRDNLRRTLVYETTTRGAYRDSAFHDIRTNEPRTLERAFLEAADALFADEAFAELLEPGSVALPAKADPDASALKLDLTLKSGTCQTGSQRFRNRYKALERGTATIRTVRGHGSGFLVSDDGYVLTNEHVVGKAREVVVVMNENEYLGRVVATAPARDVALVEIDAPPPNSALSLCRETAAVGDEVYVIGTPLDEKLDLTVTKGIISQHRTVKGLRYYQTDASINGGNSGGPAFNENGEVIGIAVAGVFTEDGAGVGINYLIPIDDALRPLVEARQPASERR